MSEPENITVQLEEEITSAIKEAIGFNDKYTKIIVALIMLNLQKRLSGKKFYIINENKTKE